MTKKLIKFYQENRMKIAYGLMLLVLLSPYIDMALGKLDLELRIKILSAIPLFILFLLNDWRTETDSRLEKIEIGLHNPDPPTFKRFPEMEKNLGDTVKDLATSSDLLDIKVIGVSAKFSWPFFKRVVDRLVNINPEGTKITISIVVTRPSKLEEWNLPNWKRDCCNSIASFEAYLEKHKKSLKDTNIELSMFEYDNLPHWHGVMLNDRILFLGRTEWFKDGDDQAWELKVGEVEYRRFEDNDSYGGTTRIERYKLWFQRYIDRSIENGWAHSNSEKESEQDGGGQQATRPESK